MMPAGPTRILVYGRDSRGWMHIFNIFVDQPHFFLISTPFLLFFAGHMHESFLAESPFGGYTNA